MLTHLLFYLAVLCPRSVDTQKAPTAEQFSYIKNITREHNKVVIEADYVQMLTGSAAFAAAKKAGLLDTLEDDNGKITLELPNDYFIANDSKQLRKHLLARDCRFEFLPPAQGGRKIDSLDKVRWLQRIYKNKLFVLTINTANEITHVKEYYLP